MKKISMKQFKYMAILLFIIIFMSALSYLFDYFHQTETRVTGNYISEIKEINQSNKINLSNKFNNTSMAYINESLEVYMCRNISCQNYYLEYIKNSSEQIHCAFFDFNLPEMNKYFKESNAKKIVYVDGDNVDFSDNYIIYENKSSYMHNKFCIFDNSIVITGSYNPTKNDETINDNNIVIIKSKKVAEIYEEYFKGLMYEYNNSYKKRYKMSRNYNLTVAGINISICFSKGGNCNNEIIKQISKAEKTIYFMLFSLTEDRIADTLIYSNYSGIKVAGIMEKSLISSYSSYGKLIYQGLDVKKDCNPGKLHHKVFILDRKVVITGSFNPGSNAENSNDENMVIIDNANESGIAEKYLKEFERVNNRCKSET